MALHLLQPTRLFGLAWPVSLKQTQKESLMRAAAETAASESTSGRWSAQATAAILTNDLASILILSDKGIGAPFVFDKEMRLSQSLVHDLTFVPNEEIDERNSSFLILSYLRKEY
jgi:hypothetical protein